MGYAKGHTYRIGNDIPLGNLWCAVLVDGSWRFVNQHWGSSHIVVGRDRNWNLISSDITNQQPDEDSDLRYRMNDDFFFTDPEEQIYWHYLNDSEWQLLARPVTYDEYKVMAYVTREFFRLGISEISQPKCIVESNNGELTFGFELKSNSNVTIKHELFKAAGGNNLTEVSGFKLHECTCVKSIDSDLNQKEVYVQLPVYGRYKLNLYAADAAKQYLQFYKICEYVIKCETPNFRIISFPQPRSFEYGLGAQWRIFGLTAVTHKDGIVQSQNGLAEIVLEQTERYRGTGFSLSAVLQFVNSRNVKEQLQSYVIHYQESKRYTFNCRLPNAGTYLLNITNSSDTSITCTYLIRSTVGFESDRPFPSITDSKVQLVDH